MERETKFVESERRDMMKKSNVLGMLFMVGLFLTSVSVQDVLSASKIGKAAVRQEKADVSKKAVQKMKPRPTAKRAIKKSPAAKNKMTRKAPAPVPKGPGDPDLRAELISAVPLGADQVRISGRITNVGGGDFVSDPSQAAAQVVLLLPHLSGPDSVPVIASVPISRLNQRQSMMITGTFDVLDYFPDFLRWGHASTNRNECEANMRVTFIVCVSYDPDIHYDSNDQNDDDNSGNDEERESAPTSRFRYIADCPS
jgi:hypothetical protein